MSAGRAPRCGGIGGSGAATNTVASGTNIVATATAAKAANGSCWPRLSSVFEAFRLAG